MASAVQPPDFHVFISYNIKTQQASADALANPLKEEGYKVFVCSTTISEGEDWREHINRGIKSCSVFIALFNNEYSNSPEFISELNYAYS